ncbi:MAG: response regulator [Verrucomicrobiota bacterium]|nr:response regulator [Verrucomicrobiota bacterium]
MPNDRMPVTELLPIQSINDRPLGPDPEEWTFRSALNHKLRSPLNAIIGFAELLSLKVDGRRSDADIQQILNAAREMLAVIEKELGEAAPTSPEKPASPQPTRTCDVLYVEDDPVNFTLVERILEYRPSIKLLHAPQGRLGVQLAEAYRPKLVLLDLNLPDMHGSEVLKRLQDQATTANIPVVVLSANATPSAIERLLSAGAKNYLTKPFNIDHFLTVVDEFVPAS